MELLKKMCCMDPASGSLDPEHNDHAAFTQAEVNQLASSPPTSSPRQARSPMNKNCINQSYQTPMVKKTPSKNTYTAARINTCSSRKGGNANGNMNDSFDVWYTPHETPSRRHKSKAKSPPKMGQLQRNDSRDFEDFAADILDESKSRSKCALSIGVEDYAHFHVEQGPAKLTRPRGQTDAEFLAISNMMANDTRFRQSTCAVEESERCRVCERCCRVYDPMEIKAKATANCYYHAGQIIPKSSALTNTTPKYPLSSSGITAKDHSRFYNDDNCQYMWTCCHAPASSRDIDQDEFEKYVCALGRHIHNK